MIKRGYHHASVSISNNLFVIGGSLLSSYEVFDSLSRNLILIKSIMCCHSLKAVSIGYNSGLHGVHWCTPMYMNFFWGARNF